MQVYCGHVIGIIVSVWTFELIFQQPMVKGIKVRLHEVKFQIWMSVSKYALAVWAQKLDGVIRVSVWRMYLNQKNNLTHSMVWPVYNTTIGKTSNGLTFTVRGLELPSIEFEILTSLFVLVFFIISLSNIELSNLHLVCRRITNGLITLCFFFQNFQTGRMYRYLFYQW